VTGAPLLAVTMGEPAGIGGELVLQAWIGRRSRALPPFVVLDDPERLESLARGLGFAVPLAVCSDTAGAAEAFERALPVLPMPLAVPARAGRPDPANARVVLASIARGVELVRSGACAALVTNPINKSALYQAGFDHPGHTEYLGALAGPDCRPVMLLEGAGLRVVPVTIHVSVRQALDQLTTEAILSCGRIAAAGLISDFGIDRPRLAVAALNPHGGEGGAWGDEEARIILPAIEALRAEGIAVTGPHPPDAMFHAAARKGYDVALCMLHDQALIPLKTLAFESGVNITLGLPFVRTSPDHGTALDLAGTGRADPSSLVAALHTAARLAANRLRLSAAAAAS
jgi:4-hydroxythreonine-4-phosphate dehydrogenase